MTEAIKLDTYSEPGLYVEEYMSFSNERIQFHQGEESKQNEENYGHSAFDKIVEYDLVNMDNMIEVLEKHYKEQQYPESVRIETLNTKSKKLLNLIFTFLFRQKQLLLGGFNDRNL